jgi:hypothetical protein
MSIIRETLISVTKLKQIRQDERFSSSSSGSTPMVLSPGQKAFPHPAGSFCGDVDLPAHPGHLKVTERPAGDPLLGKCCTTS